MTEYSDDLKINFAELDIDWRDHSANYMKWAEKWVNAVEVNLLASAKVAFEHRKQALEGLTKLWLGGYFSNPNIPSEIKERVEQGDSNYMAKQTEVLAANTRLQKRKLKPIKKV